MDGVIVTGVDTGVGKTVVCAGLMKMLQGTGKVCYWKPIQTGTIIGDDTVEVRKMTDIPADNFIEPAYRFAEPLSPYMAAKKWGKRVDLSELAAKKAEAAKKFQFMIVEGAGGLLVPFNEKELQSDFMLQLGFPLLIVAEDRVGAINQTLLTLEKAKALGLKILGVILTRARGTFGNAECISSFGKTEIVAQLSPSENQKSIIAEVGGDKRLRQLFNLPQLPL
jgi:dethiobiotin synthetase